MARVKIGKGMLRAVIACLLLAGLFALALLAVNRFQHRGAQEVQPPETEEAELLYYNGKTYRPRGNLETILLMGLDKPSDYEAYEEYLNKQQNDFLMLLVLDKQNNTCTALPLNRDTMTTVWRLDVSGQPSMSRVEQLCLAHTYGSGGDDSCKNTVCAVENLLFGQSIDHYAALNMDAVPILADLVGGVTVEIDTDMTSVDPRLQEGQTVTLEGELALLYVRARRSVSDGTNQSRMVRQERFLRALWHAWSEKAAAGGNAGEMETDALISLGERLRSDCTVQKLSSLLARAEQCTITILPPPAGESQIQNGLAEFYVDDEALQETVLQLFYSEDTN